MENWGYGEKRVLIYFSSLKIRDVAGELLEGQGRSRPVSGEWLQYDWLIREQKVAPMSVGGGFSQKGNAASGA
jgi:hypothetical protein